MVGDYTLGPSGNRISETNDYEYKGRKANLFYTLKEMSVKDNKRGTGETKQFD